MELRKHEHGATWAECWPPGDLVHCSTQIWYIPPCFFDLHLFLEMIPKISVRDNPEKLGCLLQGAVRTSGCPLSSIITNWLKASSGTELWKRRKGKETWLFVLIIFSLRTIWEIYVEGCQLQLDERADDLEKFGLKEEIWQSSVMQVAFYTPKTVRSASRKWGSRNKLVSTDPETLFSRDKKKKNQPRRLEEDLRLGKKVWRSSCVHQYWLMAVSQPWSLWCLSRAVQMGRNRGSTAVGLKRKGERLEQWVRKNSSRGTFWKRGW